MCTDVPLSFGKTVRGAIGSESAGLEKRSGIATIGLHLSSSGSIHRRKIRIRNHDLVTEFLEAASYPLALGRCFNENQCSGFAAQLEAEVVPAGTDPLLDELSPLGED